MTTTATDLETMGRAAKQAARRMATVSTDAKNQALNNIAEALTAREKEILAANRLDYEESQRAGLPEKVLDRLLLNHDRLSAIAGDVLSVAAMPDPVGETFDMRTLPNGLIVGKTRVPLGVIGAIYESRPNVTVDIASLCLKSGNACILRGGKESVRSNTALARMLSECAASAGLPEGAIGFIENTDRALVGEMLKLRGYIDLVVPRGGAELIKFVAENASMPVLTGGTGVCHTYVDKDADLEMAVNVAHNAKVRRPTICNALDTLLVHRDVAETFLPAMARRWAEAGVEMRCDPRAHDILSKAEIRGLSLRPAEANDFGQEFLALVASVKVVDSLDEAVDHIYQYGTGHSDAILTENYGAARRFLREVDTAVVYVNASTQFTDGAQFGLAAEIIDSTQKTIARGPVSLREITTYKWVVMGTGQTRP